MCLLGAVALGCSDDSGFSGRDGGQGDGKAGGDGGWPYDARLWTCKTPGLTCNAHDPCALNPICGKDNLCRPQGFMDCGDGLDCTIDTCAGAGVCKNEPTGDWCALLVLEKGASQSEKKCVKKGTVNPQDACQACDPSKDKKKWSQVNGGSCDDGNPCTKNDYCQGGQCSGTYYGNQCSDSLQCTDDICDGKGGCSNKLKSGYCLISGKCYTANDADPSGCGICSPSDSTTAWTAKKAICKIGTSCVDKGTKDISGCGVCDPSKSSTSYSATPGTCLIGGSCYKSGDKDVSGCGTCDPSTSTSQFTPVTGKCLIGGTCYSDKQKSKTMCGVCDPTKDRTFWTPATGTTTTSHGFESGLGGVTVSAAVGSVGWQTSTKRKHSGTTSLYYGNPKTGTYDNGKANSGTATLPAVTLAAAKGAALHFWLYMDTETTKGYDMLTVSAGGKTLWEKGPSTMAADDYRRWIPVVVDLSALIGQAVSPVFTFSTTDDWANGSEGVYIDDVVIISGCGGAAT